MPRANFKISGDIKAFDQVDNLVRAMKREGEKLLTAWTLELDVNYTEKEGEVKE